MHESRQIWRKINPYNPHEGTQRFTTKRKVLDHGRVRLKQHMGSDIDICHAARVLEEYTTWRGVDDVKLLEHLYRNQHTTPFEHTAITFYIKAPIFVFRQWHRHRTQSYNEMSARYKVLPEEFYVPKPEHVGVQSKSNHQSRIINSESHFGNVAYDVVDRIRSQCAGDFVAYGWLLDVGVPREIARGVTSVNTYSEMWATANLWNWLKFLTLRNNEHAQYEIRVYAEAIEKILEEHFPITLQIHQGVQYERIEMEKVYDAWCAAGRSAP